MSWTQLHKAVGLRARSTEFLTRYAQHARMLRRVAPGYSTISLLCTVLAAAGSVLNMIATGHLIGLLYSVLSEGSGTSSLWTWFTVFAATTIAGQVLQAIQSLSDPHIWAAYRIHIEDLIAEAGLHPPGLQPLDGELAAELRDLRVGSRHWLFRFGMTGTWRLLQSRLVGVGSIIVLLPWRWWAPLVVAAAFLGASHAMGTWIGHVVDTLFGTPPVDRRRADYLAELMLQPAHAKEVRLFGIASWLGDRYEQLWESATRPFWRQANRKLLPFAVAILLMLAAVGGSLMLLALDAYHGRIGGSAVTTYVLALLALNAFGPQGDAQSGLIRVSGLLRSLTALRRGLGLPGLDSAPGEEQQIEQTRGSAVEFDHVDFTYPTRSVPTLRNLTLHIPEGQSIAVVGVNGAGKSTLIKLLAGLYPADSGTVRIGDADVFGNPAVHRKVAVIFQDFVHYPLTLRENVGFGAIEHRDDTAVLERALLDAAGSEVLDRLEHDWDVPLSVEYEGGTDLSGGQWQRVALARALAAVSSGASILVLDEPTAALDVRAEAEIFERFLSVTRGVTTILVSHRLATVRRAERIVVLDGATGHITEDGTHEELLALDGEYATMFRLQAKRFARAGADLSIEDGQA